MDGRRGREGRRVDVSAADRRWPVPLFADGLHPSGQVRPPGPRGLRQQGSALPPQRAGAPAGDPGSVRAAFVSWPEGSLGFARDRLRLLPSCLWLSSGQALLRRSFCAGLRVLRGSLRPFPVKPNAGLSGAPAGCGLPQVLRLRLALALTFAQEGSYLFFMDWWGNGWWSGGLALAHICQRRADMGRSAGFRFWTRRS
jgi:hypothetical protein